MNLDVCAEPGLVPGSLGVMQSAPALSATEIWGRYISTKLNGKGGWDVAFIIIFSG